MVAPNLGLLASPTTFALTLMFGIQSMHAYVQFGWLPQIYRDAGLHDEAIDPRWAELVGWAESNQD